MFSVPGWFVSLMELFRPVISVCLVSSLCSVFSIYVILAFPPFKVQGSLLFVTYTIIQGIISSEM